MMGRSQGIERKGFTLVELLVVMAVMGVVSGLGATAFSQMTSLWRDVRVRAELDSIADDAFEAIGKDIAQMISADVSGVAIRGVTATHRDVGRYSDRQLANDSVAIPISELTADGKRLPRMVRYEVSRENDRDLLMRTVGKLGEENPDGGPLEVINRANVARFRVEYASAAGHWRWLANWTRPGVNPRAVRVSMTLVDPVDTRRQIVRKAVFSVNAR